MGGYRQWGLAICTFHFGFGLGSPLPVGWCPSKEGEVSEGISTVMLTFNQIDFSGALARLLKRSGKTKYRVAELSGLDEGYLSRLESGKRLNSSRDTVLKIGLALVQDSDQISRDDVNAPLMSAGHAPLISRGESFPFN